MATKPKGGKLSPFLDMKMMDITSKSFRTQNFPADSHAVVLAPLTWPNQLSWALHPPQGKEQRATPSSVELSRLGKAVFGPSMKCRQDCW